MNIFFGSPLRHDRREYNKKIENNKRRQWQSSNNVSHRKALSEAFFSLKKMLLDVSKKIDKYFIIHMKEKVIHKLGERMELRADSDDVEI